MDTLRSLAIVRGRLAYPPGYFEDGFVMTCDDTFDLYLRISRQGTFDGCMGVVKVGNPTEIEVSQNGEIETKNAHRCLVSDCWETIAILQTA